jgi:Ca-activated chloride channel homolog
VLIDEERPNYFQISVGNLLPDQELVVSLRVLVPLTVTGQAWRLTLPTAIAPRYYPGLGSAEARAEFERITPTYLASVPYGLALTLRVRAGQPLRRVVSPSHPIAWESDGEGGTVSLAQSAVALDRDVVIEIEPERPAQPTVLAAARGGRDHLLVQFLPELSRDAGPRPPCKIAFLIDCSGSMGGPSIEEARRAMQACLSQMVPGDEFRVIRFGSQVDAFAGDFCRFDETTLARAKAYVSTMAANLGGTEILPALQQAVGEGTAPLTLVLMTDGQVGNEDEVIAWAGARRDRVRIFAFGIVLCHDKWLLN